MLKSLKVMGMIVLVVCFVLVGCGQNAGDKDQKKSKRGRRELMKLAIKTAAQIAPKDTETPAEEGGYGFEKIAAGLGYITHVVPEEQLKHFGDSRAKKGGMMVYVTSRFPVTMRTSGKNCNYVENSTFGEMLYEGMLDLNPVTLEFMPSLATHWKISDDKLHYAFRLNPDARWSDGKPVIAEDVIATWDLLMDETILFPSTQLVYGKFDRPVKEGKYIISVKCNELNWRNFLYFSASMEIYPAHKLKGLTGTDYLKEYHMKTLPGTGPYVMLEKDIKNQVSYAVTRRLDYWAAENPLRKYRFNFDKIKFNVVKNNRTLEYEKFKKGDQDFFDIRKAQRWVEETNYKQMQKGWILKRKLFSDKPAGTQGYCFNMRMPPFSDRRMRYAFTYLLNREKLNKELYYGEFIPQNSLYSGSVYENPNNEQIKYNPEKAMKLLAEAGWKERNSKGWLVNDKGEELRIEIGIPKVIEYRVTPYQRMLQEFGIDLQIKFVDENSMWKMLMERNFTITWQNWTGLVFPNPETSLHSRLADKNNNANLSGFKNERVDQLLEIYDREFEQQKRVEIIREIDKIVADTRTAAWTFYRYDYIVFWNKFSYPDYMVARYTGDYRSIYKFWWFDPEKIEQLDKAMAQDTSLPLGEIDVK
ncbi:ABC transporter substrate-binding protein, partial [candidate division CSSED10-310 bacterium]